MKLSLVLLTLNEVDGLERLFAQIPLEAVDEAFAVDGNSTDGTLAFYEKVNFPYVLQTRRGRGDAFRTAFERATGDAIIFFSPDGNEDPADISKFRAFLEEGADMVIGNRMSNGGRNEEDVQVIKLRKWANNFFTWIANHTWNKGPFVYDTINGFRAITRRAWHELSPDGPGYTIEYQCSIRAFKRGLHIREFPTIESGRIGPEKGSPSIATGLAFLKLYFRELRNRDW